jgi:phosphoglycolate phosphatase
MIQSASIGLRRGWDTYDAYLFDIDGTLLHCTDAVHYFAFCETLQLLAGRPLNLDGVVAHGNTDMGILRDALKLAGVPDEAWRPRIAEAQAAMCRHVELHSSKLCVSVLPDVTRVLEHLRSRGALLGVATGNLEAIGRRKLQSCGLLSYFDFGGYSNDCEYRSDVFRSALCHAQSIAGKAASVCVVGDTPSDVRAAHANELDVIAVATGVYSFETLAREKPEWCLASLTELKPSL